MRPEGVTQNRVIRQVTLPAANGGLGYLNLGDWSKREGNERFVALLTRHWPQWQESRKELNALPLSTEAWAE